MQLGLLLVAFVAAVAVLLLGRAPGWCVGCVLFLLATAPTVYTQTLDAYADVPLAIFAATGALFAWTALAVNRGASVLAVLFFAAAMLTKVEGIVLVVIVVAALVVTRSSPRPVAWGARVLGSSIGISFLPWHVWLRIHDVAGPYHFEWRSAVGTARAFSAAGSLAAAVSSPSKWLLLPLVLTVTVVFALLRAGATRDGAFVVLCLVGALIAFDLIYAGTSYPFSWHVRTSVNRVIDTPMFVAVIFVPLLLAPWDRETRGLARAHAATVSGSR
jgi:hypothetical protein